MESFLRTFIPDMHIILLIYSRKGSSHLKNVSLYHQMTHHKKYNRFQEFENNMVFKYIYKFQESKYEKMWTSLLGESPYTCISERL